MSKNAGTASQGAEAKAPELKPEIKPEERPDMVLKAEATAAENLRRQNKVELTIASTESDSSPVMVSVNGYAYRIVRDTPVEVPEAIANALKDAVYQKPVAVADPKTGQMKTTFKTVPRFSFTVAPVGRRSGTEG